MDTQITPSEFPESSPGELPQQFGRYRILGKLGAGGMGSVYLAEDTILERRIALKVPHFRADDDQRMIDRFLREARAAAQFAHPNICQIYDVGQQGGVYYLAMAYVEGTSLSTLLRREDVFPPGGVAELVCKIAQAMEVVHQRGSA